MLFVTACQKVDMDSKPGAIKANKLADESVGFNVSLKTASYLASLTNPDIKGIEAVVSPAKDTLMYFVNFKEGWIVIAADKRVDPVLALSKKGNLSLTNMDNPGVAVWFNDVADKLVAIKQAGKSVKYDSKTFNRWVIIEKAAYLSNNNVAIFKTKRKTSKLKSASEEIFGMVYARRLVSVTTGSAPTIQKGHLLQTKWGQGSDWNMNTPFALKDNAWVHCKTGCVAVSTAQIIYYLHYRLNKPTGLYHTVSSTGYIYDSDNYSVNFSRADYVDPSPRWDQMAHYWWDSNTMYASDLMADIGNRVGMKYGADGSEASPSTSAFNAYGITCVQSGFNSTTILSELDNNIPVMLGAYATRTPHYILWWVSYYSYGDGHSWVCDGYQKQGTSYTYNYVWDLLSYDPMYGDYDPNNPYIESVSYDEGNAMGLYDGKTDPRTDSYYTPFLLMNWGWNNSYYDDVLYSTWPTNSDGPWNAGVYYFQYLQDMIWNFR